MTSKILLYLSLGLAVVLWLSIGIHFKDLPTKIPIHFGFDNTPNRFGSKWNIIALPLIYSGIIFLFRVIISLAKSENSSKEAHPSYTEDLRNTEALLMNLLIGIGVSFVVLVWHTMFVAVGKMQKLPWWDMPFTLVLIFAPIVWFVVKLVRGKR
jgi:hypothetical protein